MFTYDYFVNRLQMLKVFVHVIYISIYAIEIVPVTSLCYALKSKTSCDVLLEICGELII